MILEEKISFEVFSHSPSLGEYLKHIFIVIILAALPALILYLVPEEVSQSIGLYLIYFVWTVFLFFYPSLIAFDVSSRFEDKGFHEAKHPQRTAIVLCNILIAWTIIAWFLILYWALKIPETQLEKKIRTKIVNPE